MKKNILMLSNRNRPLCLIAAMTLFLSVGLLNSALAGKAQEIDSKADVALERLYKVDGGREFAEKAKALLIMPSVGKGALIVGIEHGKGALRIGGLTEDYYSLSAGSVGLQIGGESKDIVIAFMTTAALEQFRASENWEAGVDGNIAVVAAGVG
jgi:lipid-binding SYLF domain-containing protein